jgi:hypothetical protein
MKVSAKCSSTGSFIITDKLTVLVDFNINGDYDCLHIVKKGKIFILGINLKKKFHKGFL